MENNIAIQKKQSTIIDEKVKIKNKKSLKILKGKLFIYLLFLSFFLLIVVIERAMYNFIVDAEDDLIYYLQIALLEDNSPNLFLKLIGEMGGFRYFLILLAHFYLILYFAIDVLIAIKVMTAHFIGLYLIYLLQLLYYNPRPYWNDDRIKASYCDGSFMLPDDFYFTLIFLNSYMLFCYENRNLITPKSLIESQLSDSIIENKARQRKNIKIYKAISWSIIAIIMFLKYLNGNLYLDSIFMTSMYFGFYYEILVFGENYFDELIKSSVLDTNKAKRKLFYWMIILILLQCVGVLAYMISDNYMMIDWIINYTKCHKESNEGNDIGYISNSIGTWFTFIGTSLTIILIGGLFGTFKGISIMKNVNLLGGTTKQKIIRTILTNLMLIPSWFLEIYMPTIVSNNLVTSFVINEFFLIMIHFFLIFYLQFGYVSYYILKPLKLTNSNLNNSYDYINTN